MQDFFKYDKLQQAAPLFMKSDHDGDKDAQYRGLPLGIKSTAQGIEHFTNWDNISNSLDARNSARFDDTQPMSLNFGMQNHKGKFKDVTFSDGSATMAMPDELSSFNFTDKWEVNDIHIIDDMAFVCYEDFTDVQRIDVDLKTLNPTVSHGTELSQVFKITPEETYDGTDYYEERLGTLRFTTESLPIPDRIVTGQSYGSVFTPDGGEKYLPLDFASYHNSILKIKFGADRFGGDYNLSDNTLYFIYGGVIAGDHPAGSNHPYNSADVTYDGSNPGPSTTAEEDKKIEGRFYLVVNDEQGSREDHIEGSPSIVGIQLDIKSNYNSPLSDGKTQFSELQLDEWKWYDGDGFSLHDLSIETQSITLIKIQPIRKCGKVDIYTRKQGFTTAIVSNRVSYSGHNLETNDIIEISGAEFDGSQNSYADIHPLNGKKFIKKIDNDTFEIYDDQFFEDATDTNSLKTTDRINWICISNNFDSLGQSWEYHTSIFSPTGRNGYSHQPYGYARDLDSFSGTDGSRSDTPDYLAAGFTNSYRTPHINRSKGSTYEVMTQGEIFLRFDGTSAQDPIDEYLGSYFGKNIDENTKAWAPFGSSDLYSYRFNSFPVTNVTKGPQDLYPYICQDNANETKDKTNGYWGNRFGCAIDCKFSHMSGDSKVYLLTVGERGSDVSVDLFGVEKDESRIDVSGDDDLSYCVAGSDSVGAGIFGTFRRRAVPYYLPHGKSHIIEVTVDQYGKITSITHENTLFGGGGAIVNDDSTDYIEENPWTEFKTTLRSRDVLWEDGETEINTVAAWERMQAPTIYYEDTLFYEPEYFTELASKYTTKYWIRSSIMHWFPQDIGDYHSSDVGGAMVPARVFPEMTRNSIDTVSSNAADTKSRFGRTTFGIGDDNVTYKRISRFGNTAGATVDFGGGFGGFGAFGAMSSPAASSSDSQWYIFPWVDSFGKSVAISTNEGIEVSSTTKSTVLSGSTCRSNIEISDQTEQPSFAANEDLSTEQTKSQIGQITAHFVNYITDAATYDPDKGYHNVQFKEFNKGGATSRSTSALLTLDGVKYRVLPEGYLAGEGVAEVVSSASLSANNIVWKEGLIFWADQRLYDSVSTINVFTLTNDTFQSSTTFGKSFTGPKVTTDQKNNGANVGDGFGWDIRYDDNILVTNAMDTTNEMGDDIGVLSGSTSGTRRVDFLQVYEWRNLGTFRFDQKISPTFDKRKDTYPEILMHQFKDYMVSLNGVSYENDTLGAMTWDIRLLGRYDTIDQKIILKDPLEYSLFGRDYSTGQGASYDPDVKSIYTQEVAPYLSFREKYTSSSASDSGKGYIYYDYTQRADGVYNLLDESTVRPSNYGGVTGGSKSYSSNIYSQVFFLNLPVVAIDDIQDCTITFKLNLINSYFKTIDCATGNIENTGTADTLLIPKVVCYTKDPRSMIIPNGPSGGGTSTTFPKYVDGAFTEIDGAATGKASKFPPHFRGGANDLHFYGTVPGTAPVVNTESSYEAHYYGGYQTLGELYDATEVPSWGAPDVSYYLTDDQESSMVPYGHLYGTVTAVPLTSNTYSAVIPSSTIRECIIRDSLIKSSTDNRPLFSTFDRLYHGVPSSWTRSYDDINQPTYSNSTGNIGHTLAIGFILTTVNSVDINTNTIDFTSPGFDIDALRAVEPSPNKYDRAKSKYPYSPTVAITDSEVGDDYAARDKFVEFELSSSVEDPIFSITKRVLPRRRFANKFHKIATFQYDKSDLTDTQCEYLNRFYLENFQNISNLKYISPFSPLPLGLSYDYSETWDKDNGLTKGDIPHTQNQNPIIRFGRSNVSSEITGGSKGTFSKSIQVVNTENLFYSDTSYYVDTEKGSLVYNEPPSGSWLGNTFFNTSNMMGSFDIQQPEYLPLFIQTFPMASGDFSLKTEGHINSSGLMTLKTHGVDVSTDSVPLWIGVKEKKQDISLYVRNQEGRDALSLYINEVKPSGNIPFYVKAPDLSSNLKLTFAPPITGSMPLNISGPLPHSGTMPLLARGSGVIAGQAELFMSGAVISSGNATLYASGLGVHNSSIPLIMNTASNSNVPLYTRAPNPASGNLTLRASGYAVNSGNMPLFVGTQFDINNNDAELFVSGPIRHSGQITLTTEGEVNTTNSNKVGDGNFEATLRSELFDRGSSDNSGRENAVSRTIANTTYLSNSINGNTLKSDVYTNNRMLVDSSKSEDLWFMGSRPSIYTNYTGDNSIGHLVNKNSVDPSLATLVYADDNMSSNAFYNHNYKYNDLSSQNTSIKQDAYDANGEYLVKAGMRDNDVEIGIYTINADGSVSQAGINGTESTLRTNPGLEASTTNDLGDGILDPFTTLRTDIYNYIKDTYSSTYKTYNIDPNYSEVSINDLKISKHNRCAVSLRVKVFYTRGSTTSITTTLNVILTFRVDGYGGVYTGFSSSSDYGWVIMEESGGGHSKIDAAYNVEFDKEDIYFDRRTSTWGEIWKLTESDNYSTPSRMIKFSELSDAQAYTKPENLPYITPNNRLVGFGSPFKIFDDFSVSGGKIMFVGATLFDPYVFNDLTNPYFPNAMGAVYIYRRSGDATAWVYQGAVYAKGYTSGNVLSNLSEYRNSTLSNDQYSLFGYDFDYYEDNLVVSEPGGNSDSEIGAGRAYLFDVSDTTPVLLNTYLGASISLPDSATIDSGDNFGSSIVLPGKLDPIALSDATITQQNVAGFTKYSGDSTIYNLRSGQLFGFSYETVDGVTSYTDRNIKNETSPYAPSDLQHVTDDVMSRWSRIVSMKRLDFGTTQKLGVVREFVVRRDSPYHNDERYSFRVQKLSILNLQRVVDGTLFIKGPSLNNDSIKLYASGIGGPTASAPLFVSPFNPASGVTTLYMNQVNQVGEPSITLHINQAGFSGIPLAVSGAVVPYNDSTTLALPYIMPEKPLTLFTAAVTDHSGVISLQVDGSTGSGTANTTTLFVGKDVDANSNIPLFLQQVFPGDTAIYSSGVSIHMSGSAFADKGSGIPLHVNTHQIGSGILSVPLHMATYIPPTGAGGAYTNSGILTVVMDGNNDSGYTVPQDTTLYLGANPYSTGVTTLFMNKPTDDAVTLYMNSTIATGNVPLNVSGAFVSTGSANLYTYAPPNTGITLFTHGYRE